MAQEYLVNSGTLNYIIIFHNNYIKPSKEDFVSFYENHSGIETAKYFDISRAVVSKYAREFNIPRRSFKYKELPKELTPRQIEIINGSLLGDACLESIETKNSNSRFIEKHGMEQLEYLQWKCDELKPFTTEVKFGIDKAHKINGRMVTEKKFCKIQTIKHPIFTQLEKIWYNNRIKHVPKKINLTPLSICVWYFDDGYNSGENISIYTNGFGLEEVKLLIEKLKRNQIKNCHERQNQKERGCKPEIFIKKSSCENFLKLIKNQIDVQCMQYKMKEIK